MFSYQGIERRKDVRIGDKINKVAVWIAATLTTLFLGVIVQLMSNVISNQQTLINHDAIQKERQLNHETHSRTTHEKQELKLESLDHRVDNLDKRVTVFENYAN